MERIRSINFDRVAWCCADAGIGLADLANATDVKAAALTREAVEADGLSVSQLRKIAKFFNRGLLFFMEDAPVDVERAHSPAFRTLANQKPEMSSKLKQLIERVERQRLIYLSLREDLDDAEAVNFAPPDIDGAKVKESATAVRTWLNLGARNTFESYRAAVEAKGVLVFRSNGYNGKWQIAKEAPILGFALYYPVCPAILIKKDIWESVQSFTLMHELGHLLLHKESSIDDERDFQSYKGFERDANAFAGLVLVPDEFLAHVVDRDRPADVSEYDRWLGPHTKAWGISTEVILRRLLDSDRLPQEKYLAYREWRKERANEAEADGRRLFRHREPKHIFGGVFVHTVLDSLNARHITLTKASRFLDGIKVSDLHQLEKHIADR